MALDGYTVPELPDLGAVTSNASFAGSKGTNTGRYGIASLKDYIRQDVASGKFYAVDGAKIHRMQDRVFVGAGTANDGNAFPNNGGKDFVTQNIPEGPTTSVAQFVSMSSQGTIGIMGATRSSDGGPSGAQGAIGIMGVTINDATGSAKQGSFAGYFEGQKKPGGGFTVAMEVDVADQSGVTTNLNPYTFFDADPTVNIWSAAGGARPAPGLVNTSAAMAILGNGALFQSGIVFQVGSIATNAALSLAKSHAFQWWGNGATPTNFIQSESDSGNFGILFLNGSTYIGNSATAGATGSLVVTHVNNANNYVEVAGAPPGGAAQIRASGANESINLALIPKGPSGKLSLGGPAGAGSASAGSGSALPATPHFYLVFQFNNDGGTYKIPVYNN